jgi:hypothetical protein
MSAYLIDTITVTKYTHSGAGHPTEVGGTHGIADRSRVEASGDQYDGAHRYGTVSTFRLNLGCICMVMVCAETRIQPNKGR